MEIIFSNTFLTIMKYILDWCYEQHMEVFIHHLHYIALHYSSTLHGEVVYLCGSIHFESHW